MSFLVDTSVLIEIENDTESIIWQIEDLVEGGEAELYISFFAFCEFYAGAMNKSVKNKGLVLEKLRCYPPLNPTESTAIIFCHLRQQLKQRGMLVPEFDLFIAALAVEHDLTLLTTDNHFKDIPHLKVNVLTLK